jgi:hypothetical protein
MGIASGVDVKREVSQILKETKDCLREVISSGNSEKIIPLEQKISHLLGEEYLHKDEMFHLRDQLKMLEDNLVLLGSVPSKEHCYFIQESIVTVDSTLDDIKVK